MQLSKDLSDPEKTYPALEGKGHLRFLLFHWLKSQGLNVSEAMELLTMTEDEIAAAAATEASRLPL